MSDVVSSDLRLRSSAVSSMSAMPAATIMRVMAPSRMFFRFSKRPPPLSADPPGRSPGRLGGRPPPSRLVRLPSGPDGSADLGHGDGRVGHTVGEAPLVVVPGHHPHEGAVDDLRSERANG